MWTKIYFFIPILLSVVEQDIVFMDILKVLSVAQVAQLVLTLLKSDNEFTLSPWILCQSSRSVLGSRVPSVFSRKGQFPCLFSSCWYYNTHHSFRELYIEIWAPPSYTPQLHPPVIKEKKEELIVGPCQQDVKGGCCDIQLLWALVPTHAMLLRCHLHTTLKTHTLFPSPAESILITLNLTLQALQGFVIVAAGNDSTRTTFSK